MKGEWGRENPQDSAASSPCDLAQSYTLCLKFPFPKRQRLLSCFWSLHLLKYGEEFLRFHGYSSPGNTVPTKDVHSPILGNFKNKKEVYLFSRVHNCRPLKAENWPNGILRKSFSHRAGPQEMVLRWKQTVRPLRPYLLGDIRTGPLWGSLLCQVFLCFFLYM